MKLSEIRKVLMLQSVESSDKEEKWLISSEKSRASSQAGAPLPKEAKSREQNAFLNKRADILLNHLSHSSSVMAKWMGHVSSHRFGAFAFVLLFAAALIGFLTNELGPEKRINILAFPLLGILLWNGIVFIFELIALFRSREKLSQSGPLLWLVRFLGKSPIIESEDEKEISRAVHTFTHRWEELTIPLRGARLKMLLHFTAIVLAASAICGMYVKGLANEYRAVWESTFFESGEQLRPLLSTILGPAAAIQGAELPSAQELDQIRFQPEQPDKTGENAARWIHWYAITIGLFIILPRLIFALIWRFREKHLAHTLPWKDVAPRYFDHLLSVSSGKGLEVAIIPYAHKPSEAGLKKVERLLEDHYERAVTLVVDKMIEFGEEEDAVTATSPGATSALLMNFASTPEKETHLVVYQTLAAKQENPLAVILDAERFDQKAEAFSDRDQRRADRFQAWEDLFATTGCEILFPKNASD